MLMYQPALSVGLEFRPILAGFPVQGPTETQVSATLLSCRWLLLLSSLQCGQVSVPCGCQIVVPFSSADSETCVQLCRLLAALFPHGQSLRLAEQESYTAACSKEAIGIPSQVLGMQWDPRMTILSSNWCSSYPISWDSRRVCLTKSCLMVCSPPHSFMPTTRVSSNSHNKLP